MDKMKAWLKIHKPTQRKWIQLYTALLYNANIKGFVQGEIYTGKSKKMCVPGFNCYSCPGAIGACPLGALQNAIATANVRFPYYVLGLLAIFGMTLGRVICGFLCPIGWLQELLHKLPTYKIPKSRFTRALSYLKYIVLLLFVVCIPLFYATRHIPVPAFCKYICPVGTFEGAIGLLANPANAEKFSMLNILFTRKFVIFIILAVGAVFIYRIFCRFLCPLGAIYGFFCRIALLGVSIDEDKCIGCTACVKKCQMDVCHVGDHECIQCGQCINVCPTKAIHWKHAGRIGDKGKKLRIGAWIVALVFLAVVLIWVNRPEKAMPPVGKEEGMLAPDFILDTYGGESFSLSANQGKITIINFWATWCTPCVNELPYFQQIYSEYGEEVAVIAIHSSLVTDDVAGYLADSDYTMPFGLDEDGSIIDSFGGSTMLPMTVIVDKNGVIVYNRVGSVTYDFLALQMDSLQE